MKQSGSTEGDFREELEDLIDASSLHYLLEELAVVCEEKAEHLRSNWQDEGAARVWDRFANKIASVAHLARVEDI